MRVQSELVTLETLVKKGLCFDVPIYQRLYVWGQDQVRILLEDMLEAYRLNKELFYLGGTLVMESSAEKIRLELIDGQQRFTTMWLISVALQRQMSPFLMVKAVNDKPDSPRLTFAIREKVNTLLKRMREVGPEVSLVADKEDEPDETGSIRHALRTIISFVSETGRFGNEADVEKFSDFIYTRVHLVLTRVPAHTDLNKLFEVINNRGVQLQQHEILKAKMLRELPLLERPHYARLWEACAEMGDYVEKTLNRLVLRSSEQARQSKSGNMPLISTLFDKSEASTGTESLAKADSVLDWMRLAGENATQDDPLSLAKLLDRGPMEDRIVSEVEDPNVDSSGVRSIVGFPLLLEHVLRVWLCRHGRKDLERLSDKELLDVFSRHFFHLAGELESQVRSFIGLLWELRYLFDRHVIKWVVQGEEQHHLIKPIQISESGTSRSLYRDDEPETLRGFSLLQSMLYHAQPITTMYWLTPLLNYLHTGKRDMADAADFLRHMDNHWFCAEDGRTMIQRSRAFMDNAWENSTPSCQILEHDLKQKPLGVSFPHYWFYKLEYVLWFLNSRNKEAPTPSQFEPAWLNNYRITARNSVEHISPRKPKSHEQFPVSYSYLDLFGNLALVSCGVNSEYGNLPFLEKRARFEGKNTGQKAERVDSLKMALIYQQDHWGDDCVEKHQREMNSIMEQYFSVVDSRNPSQTWVEMNT